MIRVKGIGFRDCHECTNKLQIRARIPEAREMGSLDLEYTVAKYPIPI